MRESRRRDEPIDRILEAGGESLRVADHVPD